MRASRGRLVRPKLAVPLLKRGSEWQVESRERRRSRVLRPSRPRRGPQAGTQGGRAKASAARAASCSAAGSGLQHPRTARARRLNPSAEGQIIRGAELADQEEVDQVVAGAFRHWRRRSQLGTRVWSARTAAGEAGSEGGLSEATGALVAVMGVSRIFDGLPLEALA